MLNCLRAFLFRLKSFRHGSFKNKSKSYQNADCFKKAMRKGELPQNSNLQTIDFRLSALAISMLSGAAARGPGVEPAKTKSSHPPPPPPPKTKKQKTKRQ